MFYSENAVHSLAREMYGTLLKGEEDLIKYSRKEAPL